MMEKIQGVIFLVVATCAVLLPRPGNLQNCFEVQVGQLLEDVSASADRVRSLASVKRAVEATLNTVWPGSKVKLFGSLSTGLGSPHSDADLSVVPPHGLHPDRHAVDQARAAFQASPHHYRQIHTRTRLPAISFYFAPGNITCDIHFRTDHWESIESSLVRYLLHTDGRALRLAITVKYWAELHKLIRRKYLTSYGMMMLVIFFLQQRNILPSVVQLQGNVPANILNGTNRFNVAFEKQNFVSINNESLYEILGTFFEYYEHFDFDQFIVCPYTGEPVRKSLFKHLDTVPAAFSLYIRNVANNITTPFNRTALCIQSLLMLNDNCGWRVDTATRFQDVFRAAANSYREKGMCTFLSAIGLN